jgi:hypothetical protein
MTKQTRLALAGVFSLVFVVAVVAVPLTAHNSNSTSTVAIEQEAAQTQSVSGTISAVSKTNFVLTVQPKASGAESVSKQDPPKTMTFQIDNNTTVEGKLQVGSNAEVTYRDDRSGNHLAIGVKVTAPKS